MNFKYCPNCQSSNIQIPEQRWMECADCDYVYFHNAAAAVAGIIVCGEEILFNVRNQQPHKGKLDLAGGFVDFNESLEEALSREIKEELGLEISNWQYVSSFPNSSYLYKTVNYQTADAVFYTTLADKPNLTIQQEELQNAVWCHYRDINFDNIGFQSLQRALKKFIQEHFEDN